ncbi:MAG: HD domain-containing protein [Desulfosudaceae bacterium]
MKPIYIELRRTARRIAACQPAPDFYHDFSLSVGRSRRLFQDDPLVRRLREIVRVETRDNMGHGLAHAKTVALDAGTITAIETGQADFGEPESRHAIRMAHCAGLLHDIRRRQPDHAEKGAAAAREILSKEENLAPVDVERIAFAIAHHEAFKEYQPPRSIEGRILAGSLYDADKFRWGPDNFTDTVWDMLAASPIPPAPEKFARLYPRAMAYIARIKTTFRTPVGRQYGPQFIDIGLDIGDRLWNHLREQIPETE